jgi:hypothetical protein
MSASRGSIRGNPRRPAQPGPSGHARLANSLVGDVIRCDEPSNVVYWPPERWQRQMPDVTGVAVVTLSRFRRQPVKPAVGDRWWMSEGGH